MTELACRLNRRFPDFPADILSVDEMAGVGAVRATAPTH